MQKIVLIAAIICITFPFGIEVNAAPQFLIPFNSGGSANSAFAGAAGRSCFSNTDKCKQEFKELGEKIKKFFQRIKENSEKNSPRDPVGGLSPTVLAAI